MSFSQSQCHPTADQAVLHVWGPDTAPYQLQDIQFLTEGFAQSVNFPAFLSFCNKKYQKTFFEGLCGINLF